MSDEPLDFTLTRLPFFLRPELPGMADPERKAFGTWGDQIDRYTRSLAEFEWK